MKISDESTPRRVVMLFAMLILLFWLSVKLLEICNTRAESKQSRMIVASYYQETARGHVPLPADTNAIRVFRKEPGPPPRTISVRSVSGDTNCFYITRLADSSGANWRFKPK